MRTTYGDLEFTGELAQELGNSENPEGKLPALYEALGVATDREAVLALASLCVPGFKRKSPRRKPGRKDLISQILDDTDSDMRDIMIPDIIRADYEEHLFKRMEAILDEAAKKGRKLKVSSAAAQVIEEEALDELLGPFHVERSVSKGRREKIAASVGYLFTHRARRRKQHEAIRRPFVESERREVEKRLRPHWAAIYEELRQRMIKEAEARLAAGGDLEEILAHIPDRMIAIARDITHRYF
jgi:hypothetical protein